MVEQLILAWPLPLSGEEVSHDFVVYVDGGFT